MALIVACLIYVTSVAPVVVALSPSLKMAAGKDGIIYRVDAI